MAKPAFVKPSRRPVLQIPESSLEIGLETAAGLGILTMFYVTIKFWPLLPESIPHHFGASGRPDAWGGKWTLWLLPGISLVLYVGLTLWNDWNLFCESISSTLIKLGRKLMTAAINQ